MSFKLRCVQEVIKNNYSIRSVAKENNPSSYRGAGYQYLSFAAFQIPSKQFFVLKNNSKSIRLS